MVSDRRRAMTQLTASSTRSRSTVARSSQVSVLYTSLVSPDTGPGSGDTVLTWTEEARLGNNSNQNVEFLS